MDEANFGSWELTKQRESITPANLWTVTRVMEENDEPSFIGVHGRSGLEVAGIPMTGVLLRSFGFWLSTKRGMVTKTDRALIRNQYPSLYVYSLPESIDQFRECFRTFRMMRKTFLLLRFSMPFPGKLAKLN